MIECTSPVQWINTSDSVSWEYRFMFCGKEEDHKHAWRSSARPDEMRKVMRRNIHVAANTCYKRCVFYSRNRPGKINVYWPSPSKCICHTVINEKVLNRQFTQIHQTCLTCGTQKKIFKRLLGSNDIGPLTWIVSQNIFFNKANGNRIFIFGWNVSLKNIGVKSYTRHSIPF